MANTEAESEDASEIGTFPMVTYGYGENHDGATGEKTISVWEQANGEDDPASGWREVDKFFDLETIVIDGEEVPEETTGSVGNEDQNLYRVSIQDGVAEIQTDTDC